MEWARNIRFDQLAVSQTIDDNLQNARVTSRSFIEGLGEGQPIEINVRVAETGAKSKDTFNLKKGINVYPVNIEISTIPNYGGQSDKENRTVIH